jgi:hypothetical protein
VRTAGSAIRSFSVKSAMVFTFGLMVLRNSGMAFSAATALTPMLARVRDQIVNSGPTPPEAKSRLPDRIASFMALPAENWIHSLLRSSPSFLPSSSRKPFCSMMVSGR